MTQLLSPRELVMFTLKPLKSKAIPFQWIVMHFDGNFCDYSYMQYKDGKWKERDRSAASEVTLLGMADTVRSKEICWLVGNGMYPWLCHQGLYEQFVNDEVSLPLGNGSSNKGKLTGQFCCADPCIMDIVVGKKRFHCLDLNNFGIHETKNCEDAVRLTQDYVAMVIKHQMGALKSTAPAQGMARFRSHDMGKHLIFCHQMPEVRQLERDAFYGGRAECKTIGKVPGRCWDYDAKSLHPTIGLTKEFPVELVDFCECNSDERIAWHIAHERHIVAKVVVNITEPCFPLRHCFDNDNKDWRTIYPVGKFQTTLCQPEFRCALDNDLIDDIGFWAAYRADVIFRENSEWYFRTKEELKNSELAHMSGSLKLLQNSCYGNIGRRGRHWMDGDIWHDAQWGMWYGRHPIVGNVVNWRAIYGNHQYLDSGLEPETSCPAISATMFSYSRMQLWDMIKAAGIDNVHMYDTDGLAVTEGGREGLEAMPVDLQVKKESDDVDIRGIKYYRFGDKWTHAGVPEWAQRHLDGSASFEKHEPFNYGLWHGTPFAAKWLVAKNDPRPVYKHGVVLPNGRTEPFVMDFVDGRNVLVS